VCYPSFTKLREHFDCLIALLWHVLLAAMILWYFGWLALLLCLIVPHFIASGIGSTCFTPNTTFRACRSMTMPVGLTTKRRWSPPVS